MDVIKFIYLILFFLTLNSYAGLDKKEVQICPPQYAPVPKLSPYNKNSFCVAKYEMKKGEIDKPVSVATGLPWVNINRKQAIEKCRSIGKNYDLISNDQWQSIAINISSVNANWNSNTAYEGEINRGHSDNNPPTMIPASNDEANENCFETQQKCSNLSWNSQRRTHTLTNNNIIWDFSGNVWEWVKDDNNVLRGDDAFISAITKDPVLSLFGNKQKCALPDKSSSFCGYGFGWIHYSEGAVMRGGSWSADLYSGIYATYLNHDQQDYAKYIGFRCVFLPSSNNDD